MPRVLHLLLLLAVSLGIVGQGVAFAAAPLTAASSTMAVSSDAAAQKDCGAMASMGDDSATPCKGLTADCIEQMGCISPFALAAPAIGQSAPTMDLGSKQALPLLRELAGRSVAPLLDPPTTLV